MSVQIDLSTNDSRPLEWPTGDQHFVQAGFNALLAEEG
jgi:hypothetical protein